MMNLAIDIGNSSTKIAVMDGRQIVESLRVESVAVDSLDSLFARYSGIDAAIMTSVRGDEWELEAYLRAKVKRYLRFDQSTPVPLKNRYDTPLTLGCDRMAAAVGANMLYPERNILIVDFGTAITIDMVSASGEFLGGNISPGAMTRFRALHDYTGRLPMGALREEASLLGRDSLDAVESGVVKGIEYEIEGYITALEDVFSDLKIIFTGGDGIFFAKRVKKTIFASYDLVVCGLNRILEYNAE